MPTAPATNVVQPAPEFWPETTPEMPGEDNPPAP